MKPNVHAFFDSATWTLTYVVSDPQTQDAIIIDPVWDYDPSASKLSFSSLNRVLDYVKNQGLKIYKILETHAHADHVSGAQELKRKLPHIQIGIGSKIKTVQETFKALFNLNPTFKTDGSQFDFLLEEGELLLCGSLKVETLFTPGHTPACCTYIIGDAVFTGDTLFMPDYGSGRCDFPEGSAKDLFYSVQNKIYKLPNHFRVFVGHDYLPNGRALAYETSIGESKKHNIHINEQTSLESFVQFRSSRDKTLSAPRLLLPSIQLNINAGHLPHPEENGKHYLKIPLQISIEDPLK